MRTTSNDSVNGMVVKGSAYILRLSFLIQVQAEVVFLNHIHIDVFGKSGCGSVMGLVSGHVCGVILVEISRFINGFVED